MSQRCHYWPGARTLPPNHRKRTDCCNFGRAIVSAHSFARVVGDKYPKRQRERLMLEHEQMQVRLLRSPDELPATSDNAVHTIWHPRLPAARRRPRRRPFWRRLRDEHGQVPARAAARRSARGARRAAARLGPGAAFARGCLTAHAGLGIRPLDRGPRHKPGLFYD
jgi:hypothetical protein